MTLPVELETSVNQLRTKHTALINAVNAYRSGTIDASKQDLLDLANDIDKQLTVEEHTLLGQVARKGRMPSLLLDFANDKYAVGDRRLERFTSLENILTFSRSTGGGRFNEVGQYEWVEADVPRIDYDPVTKVCKGLLVEEQRTNLLSQSNSFGSTNWVQADVTVTAGAAISPEGASNASRVVSGSGSIRYVRATVILSPNTTYTFSAWIRADIAGSPCDLHYFTSQDNVVEILATPLTTKWERYSGTFKTGDAVGELQHVYIGRSLKEGVPVYVWGAQLEVGTFPTSYIPTNGAAVTRAADACYKVPGGELNNGGFTVVWEGSHIPSSTPEGYSRDAFLLNEGTAGYFGFSYTGQHRSGVGGVAHATHPRWESDFRSGAPAKVAKSIDYRTGKSGVAVNGQHVLYTDTTVRVPVSPKLHIHSLATYMSDSAAGAGHLRSLTLYPYALTDTELQELTQ